MHHLVFAGMRISTWVAVAAFVWLNIARPDRKALLAAAAWLFGFEVPFQITSLAEGRPLPAWGFGPFILIALGVIFVSVAWRRGVRPAVPLLVLAAVIWLAWVVTGFHVNEHDASTGFNSTGEALNEAAKTVFALAYLWPLWRSIPSSGAEPSDESRRPELLG
jgi:hypothetical protein